MALSQSQQKTLSAPRKRRLIQFQPLLFANGILLIILSVGMLIPVLLDWNADPQSAMAFGRAAFVTCFMGAGLYLSNKSESITFNLREAFLLTASCWMILPIFAAIPFMLAGTHLSFTDAYFEAMSGLTTTGATVLTDVDGAPRGILLWRALLNGLGGLGVIVLAMAILPMLSIGGMQLFRTESSDRLQKILPRAKQVAAITCGIYLSLVALCMFGFSMAGMNWFDAICHAFSAIATGGFSTHTASFRFFHNPWIELVGILGMLAGAMPILFYFQLLRGDIGIFFRSSQVRAFGKTVFGMIALVVFWRWLSGEDTFLHAVRGISFNMISVITTTGFVSDDYDHWGPFSVAIFFIASFIGGCAGSTTGGVKIYRLQLLWRFVGTNLKQLLQPNGVFTIRYEGQPIARETMLSVLNFFVAYVACFVFLGTALSATGLDLLSAFSSVAMALANMGVGVGPIVGPAGNFQPINDAGTWILSFAMLLGRLELFTILVLCLPQFWRD